MMHVTDSPKTMLKKIQRAENEILHIELNNPNLNAGERASLKKILDTKLNELKELKQEYKNTTGEDYQYVFKSSSSRHNFMAPRRTSSNEPEINNSPRATL